MGNKKTNDLNKVRDLMKENGLWYLEGKFRISDDPEKIVSKEGEIKPFSVILSHNGSQVAHLTFPDYGPFARVGKSSLTSKTAEFGDLFISIPLSPERDAEPRFFIELMYADTPSVGNFRMYIANDEFWLGKKQGVF